MPDLRERNSSDSMLPISQGEYLLRTLQEMRVFQKRTSKVCIQRYSKGNQKILQRKNAWEVSPKRRAEATK
nr:MAG TPA: hypothetical protein [Caudoviricetes sp.]